MRWSGTAPLTELYRCPLCLLNHSIQVTKGFFSLSLNPCSLPNANAEVHASGLMHKLLNWYLVALDSNQKIASLKWLLLCLSILGRKHVGSARSNVQDIEDNHVRVQT